MCREGRFNEAYSIALEDYNANPLDVWVQRGLGWTLYYKIKDAGEKGDFAVMLDSVEELKSLGQLTIEDDHLIFENVLFKIAEFLKNGLAATDTSCFSKLNAVFDVFRDWRFGPSKGYSYLLQAVMKFEQWDRMAEFYEWWNLDNLLPEDYNVFVTDAGRRIMSLAERAYISCSKALLKLNCRERIVEFLPRLDALMTSHSEMIYPGYFYGKLLLALGGNKDEALKVVIPFARRKSTEFWVWQLLSEVYHDEPEMQLACLLRAVSCRTQEAFLGKVRIKLASLYINRGMYDCAKYHIDQVVHCYMSNGWRLPNEIDSWIHQSWINITVSNSSAPIDFMSLTNELLCNGAEESVAVVTYFDQNSKKTSLVYGYKLRMAQKLKIKARPGDVLRINHVSDPVAQVKILNAVVVSLPQGLNYAKEVTGVIDRRQDNAFAFLKSESLHCYVNSSIVQKMNLHNGDRVKVLAVYDYNRRKDAWDWVCVNVKR